MGFFDVYDQYLLNILYDPRIRPGMTREQVDELLPEVLATARAWITIAKLPRHANGLGEPGAKPTQATDAALPRSMNAQTSRKIGTN
jgi:hypothetical protein